MAKIGKLIKLASVLFGVIAVSTLITEIILVSFYLSQGTITQSSLQDIKAILDGKDPSEFNLAEESTEKEQNSTPSQQEVSEDRVIRIVNLHNQLTALKAINGMLKKESDKIEADKNALDDQINKFKMMREELAEQNSSEAVKKTRNILQSLKPDSKKVEYLMIFSATDCVTLLNKMDPQEISKILLAFSDFNNDETKKRGQEIIQQIYAGGSLAKELERYTNNPNGTTQRN